MKKSGLFPSKNFWKRPKQAMGRQVFKQEFADRPALADEFSARTPEATLHEIRAKIPAQNPDAASNATDRSQLIHAIGSEVSRKKRSRSSLE